MFDWKAAIECPNQSCIPGKHIPLPYSTPLRIAGNQPDSPKDGWQAFVVCHWCGTGRIYSRQDVRWGQSQDFGELWGQTSFRYIGLKCDHKDCELPIRVHMLADKPWREKTSLLRLTSVIGAPRCRAGHSPKSPPQIVETHDVLDFGESTL
jgi:hypothetical protein